jgi:RNA polymerase sigma factor (sigma-70 family)
VAQMVLAKMLKLLRDFQYNPAGSFRSWLKTVARHVWSDLRVSQARVISADSLILSIEAQADLEARLEAAYDHELLELAMAQVRAKVEPTTWEVFQLTAIEGLPSATVAQRLSMAVGNVYASKYRVQKLLQQAVLELEGTSGADGCR